MEALALFISLAALICAGLAYRKSGGSLDELKPKVEDIGLATESLRKKTADMLEGLEKRIRGEEKKSGDRPVDKDDSQQAAA